MAFAFVKLSILANCSLRVVVLINPKVELGNSRLRVDVFESTEEGKREEFVEFVTDKVIESFSLVDAITVEKDGLNDVSINNIENVM
ncbi:MAG: hypothetical protein ACRD6Q_08815, partial [Nitrososphaeraceae archaeon]